MHDEGQEWMKKSNASGMNEWMNDLYKKQHNVPVPCKEAMHACVGREGGQTVGRWQHNDVTFKNEQWAILCVTLRTFTVSFTRSLYLNLRNSTSHFEKAIWIICKSLDGEKYVIYQE